VAHVEGGCDRVGEREHLAGGGAAPDSVGAVRRPVEEGEAAGSVREGDDVADLALGHEREG